MRMRALRSFSPLAALLRRASASAMPRCRATPDTENPQRLHHGISDSRHWPSLHEFAAADAAVVVELRKVAAVVEPELARRDVTGHHQLHVRIRRLEQIGRAS